MQSKIHSKNGLTSRLTIYFPENSCQQLLALQCFKNSKHDFTESKLDSDWQKEFCSEFSDNTEPSDSDKNIPWNQLRAMQFNIEADTQTIVCCDPVMMQMTHRGAYLWGQQPLEFSKEDVIRIIAQINQQLMGEGECFYLLDNNQWLYTNKKKIELSQASFEEYIGKDMFGFSYTVN